MVLGWMETNDDHAATDGRKASCLLRMISLASGVESRPVFQRDTSVVKMEERYGRCIPFVGWTSLNLVLCFGPPECCGGAGTHTLR
ncbi:hypothetical protein BDR05DRAFT_955999 [Suillus weaverae]|nr:hypothetical protein BDR05DRAFT_955999 [Suillus weaverae]